MFPLRKYLNVVPRYATRCLANSKPHHDNHAIQTVFRSSTTLYSSGNSDAGCPTHGFERFKNVIGQVRLHLSQASRRRPTVHVRRLEDPCRWPNGSVNVKHACCSPAHERRHRVFAPHAATVYIIFAHVLCDICNVAFRRRSTAHQTAALRQSSCVD